MNCTSYKCVDLVAEILIRPSALAYVLGNRVSTELLRLSAELAQGTLLGIDMRRTNPIDYIFTKHAFGPICDSARINGHFDIIFLGDEPQIRHTLHGLLIHANKPYDRTGDIIADAAGLLHVKYIDTSDRVQFISNLTTVQSDVLKYVNSTSGTTVSELLDFLKKGTGHAHAVKDIGAAYESLAERKFLYHEVNGGTENTYAHPLHPQHTNLTTMTDSEITSAWLVDAIDDCILRLAVPRPDADLLHQSLAEVIESIRSKGLASQLKQPMGSDHSLTALTRTRPSRLEPSSIGSEVNPADLEGLKTLVDKNVATRFNDVLLRSELSKRLSQLSMPFWFAMDAHTAITHD